MHKLLEGIFYKVKALVPHKAADHSDNGNIRVFGKSHKLLQLGLVFKLAAHVLGRIVFKNALVGFGVVYLGIYSVDNAVKFPFPQP